MRLIIEKEYIELIDKRTKSHLEDLKFHDYSLEWLIKVIYIQALIDLISINEKL